MPQQVDISDFDYQRIAVIAWRTLRRLGVPETSLPDASQDVLLVLHRRREDFRGDSSLSTWVYGIVVRVASNYRRTRKRSFALFDSSRNASEIPVSAKSPSPLDQVEQRAAVAMLERILAEMPEELRSAFVLVELEELETAEAAGVLQVSESTCRSWLQRARKTFNAAIAREESRQSRETRGRQ
jgi:RNA polymerase sigma-70 factor (ECF subfamily)